MKGIYFYKAKKITDSGGTYYVGHKTYQLSGTDPDLKVEIGL
jgi:hypothetical protein